MVVFHYDRSYWTIGFVVGVEKILWKDCCWDHLVGFYRLYYDVKIGRLGSALETLAILGWKGIY